MIHLLRNIRQKEPNTSPKQLKTVLKETVSIENVISTYKEEKEDSRYIQKYNLG